MPTEKTDTTKPPMPEEGIIGTLPAMKLKLLNDIEHFSGGRTCPVFEGRKVHDGDKELGDISAEVAGRGLQVHVNGPNRDRSLDLLQTMLFIRETIQRYQCA